MTAPRPLVLALLVVLVAPVAAQPAAPPDAAAGVRAAVAELFDGMRAADTTRVRAVFHPDLRLLTAVADSAGVRVVEADLDRFLAAVAAPPAVLDERLGDVEVRVDGPLATAWMPYRFYVGSRFSHCGVNAMHLVRDGEANAAGGAHTAGPHTAGAGWRIVHVVDTRRADCD